MGKDTSQTLIIIRHAHRDTSSGSSRDNGLTEKGQEQAKKLKKYFKSHFGQTLPVILSSPKVRCVETVEKISKQTGAAIEIEPLLDEGGGLEQKAERLEFKLSEMGSEVVILCSHGDVIPVLTMHLVGTPILLDKGGWIHLEQVGKRFTLRQVVQQIPE